MSANTCPLCGNEVMPYRRFMREAEPYKTSTCGSCGGQLRRDRKVYLLLLIMCVILATIGAPIFALMAKAGTSFIVMLVISLALTAGWGFLINYLGWRLIGWIPTAKK